MNTEQGGTTRQTYQTSSARIKKCSQEIYQNEISRDNFDATFVTASVEYFFICLDTTFVTTSVVYSCICFETTSVLNKYV